MVTPKVAQSVSSDNQSVLLDVQAHRCYIVILH